MRASIILALSVSSLAIASGAAADETVKRAPRGNQITLETITIPGRLQRPQAVVDVNRIVPRAPLPELRKPLLERISAAAENDPF